MGKARLVFLMMAVAANQDAALQLTQENPPAPVFRAGTRLVQVDVVVRDKSGPVKGLNRDDFTVLDNGKPQRISVFSVKSQRSTTQPAVPLPPGAVSNRVNRNGQAPATSTVLLIDRVNTSPLDQPYANRKIVKFLEARGEQDRIGLYALGGGVQIIQELTDDQQRLNRAVASLKPVNANKSILHNPSGPFDRSEPEMEGRPLDEYTLIMATERALSMQAKLEAIAAHLAKVPGRKSLIWISGSFPLQIKTAHETKDFSREMQQAARALNEANVALYAVDARGLVGGFGKQFGFTIAGLDTMNMLAGLTGGRAFYADNGIDALIREAVEDSELIYTLGFYPSEESQDGDWHKLKVTVARHGVGVRYRENYLAAKNAPGAVQRATLDQLLRDPLDGAEIGLLAETARDQTRPDSYAVRISIDLHDVRLERQNSKWVGAVDLSFYLEGDKSAQTVTRKIEIPDSELAAALEKGTSVEASVRLDKPREDLRVVAQDKATGAAGSLRIPLGQK
jgi:VWFA-related protein